MKRDDDYLRQILFDAEESDDAMVLVAPDFKNSDKEEKFYHHVDLLCDAGLFAWKGEHAVRLTNSGHDFLAAVRDDTVWRKTKEGAEKVGGLSLGMIRDLALCYVKAEVAKKLGIEL